MATDNQIRFTTTTTAETWKVHPITNPRGYRREFAEGEIVSTSLFRPEDLEDLLAKGLAVRVP